MAATVPDVYPLAEAVTVPLAPTSAAVVPALTLTCCATFQLAVVKVRLEPADIERSESPLCATATVTLLLGCEDSSTPKVEVVPCAIVSTVGFTMTVGPSTLIETGYDVVLWPRLSVATAVSE